MGGVTSGQFSIREESHGTERWLILAGELDLAATQELEPALLRACDIARRVVFDLRDVGFMDSMGLRSVMSAKELCAERGVEFVAIPNTAVLKIFEVTGLVDEVPWHKPEA